MRMVVCDSGLFEIRGIRRNGEASRVSELLKLSPNSEADRRSRIVFNACLQQEYYIFAERFPLLLTIRPPEERLHSTPVWFVFSSVFPCGSTALNIMHAIEVFLSNLSLFVLSISKPGLGWVVRARRR